jgi:glycerophosphoinositol glycerophosphodiesterase
VLLDWAHHHLLWNLCGVSAILMQKDFISLWVILTAVARPTEFVTWVVFIGEKME